ncbi:flavodoxin [Pseudoflavonifractor capillosus]|uniref:Flavodoxin n=1 Tax=Pseudoflavonifractor capillosus TaxID=106588 RepID=A0A921MML8_9FIRM|nr:flavodoxin [Pseudoflavonifractor capillosus]HJG87393.1 flavodoxin [Pseudoflavonifractor capillosus]
MKFTWKKLLSLSLAAVMALSLAACGQSDTTDDSQSAGQSQEETSTPAPTPTPENGEDISTPDASEPEDSQSGESGGVLVVYYSATGNTEAVAGYIAEATGGDLFELEPAEPYTDADLNWTDENSRVTLEHEDESLRDVELVADTVDNWDSYDTVFIGYPIWWGIAAWPVDTFVETNDFTGKTVIPFCTSSSSGLGQSGELLAEMAGTGDWQEGERFRSSASQEDVTEWVDSLGLSA